jgi:hypothetical protein
MSYFKDSHHHRLPAADLLKLTRRWPSLLTWLRSCLSFGLSSGLSFQRLPSLSSIFSALEAEGKLDLWQIIP